MLRVLALLALATLAIVPHASALGTCAANSCVAAGASAFPCTLGGGNGGAGALVVLVTPAGLYIVSAGGWCMDMTIHEIGWHVSGSGYDVYVVGRDTPIEDVDAGAHWRALEISGVGGFCDTWLEQRTFITPASQRHFGCPVGAPIVP